MNPIASSQAEHSNLAKGWRRYLGRPIDMASLVFFRVAFGLMVLYDVLLHFQKDRLGYFWVRPTFQFTYPGFGWVTPLPGNGLYVLFGIMGLLGILIALGFFYRVCTTLFFLAFTYVFLLDQSMYLNHAYLISLLAFILIFTPAHRYCALDARRSGKHQDTTAAWHLYLLRFQLGLVYFFGGIAKLNADWLHGEPMRTWLAEHSRWPIVGPYFLHEPVVYLFAYGGMLYDLTIVPLLLWKRTRVAAFLLSLFFHLTNASLFSIGVFPWLMICATTLFFSPDWPRRFIPASKKEKRPTVTSTWNPSRPAIAFWTCFIAWQLLMPIRHFLYPGNPSWTEEGHNFAWHMKLNRKEGLARFFVIDEDTQEKWVADPADYLSRWQAKRMPTRPQMIEQFAKHIATELKKQGRENVSVRAGVIVSLNGRESQLLIDPDVDLVKVRTTLLPATWIKPLTEPLPLPGPPAPPS